MATSGTSGISQAGAHALYQQTWGSIAPETVYQDVCNFKGYGVVKKSVLDNPIKKSLHTKFKALSTTTGGAGTAGYALVPVFVDPTIVDQERRETPMREIIPRVTNLGTTADWNERTAKGDASSKLEDAALSDNTDTYDRLSKAIKYYYSVGRTTGPMQAAMPPAVFEDYTSTAVPNAKQLEVAARTADLAVREEIDLISGNPGGTYTSMSTNTDTGYDANSVLSSSYYGIKSQLSDENQDDQAGAAITLDDVNDNINLAWEDGGRPSLLLTDGRTTTDLKALMVQQFRVAPSTSVAWGFQTIAFEGPRGTLPIVQSQVVRTTAGDGSGTLYGSKSICTLDMAQIEQRVLQDYTYEPLAKTNDSDKFLVKFYGCPIVKGVNTTDATSFHGSIIDIA